MTSGKYLRLFGGTFRISVVLFWKETFSQLAVRKGSVTLSHVAVNLAKMVTWITIKGHHYNHLAYLSSIVLHLSKTVVF